MYLEIMHRSVFCKLATISSHLLVDQQGLKANDFIAKGTGPSWRLLLKLKK